MKEDLDRKEGAVPPGIEIPGIPGMRMVVFSLVLLGIILFRREGIMGTRELTWKRIGAFLRRQKA